MTQRSRWAFPRLARVAAAWVAAVVLGAGALAAQGTTGKIEGTVRDQSGAALNHSVRCSSRAGTGDWTATSAESPRPAAAAPAMRHGWAKVRTGTGMTRSTVALCLGVDAPPQQRQHLHDVQAA